MKTSGTGYNPFRRADGTFCSKDEVGDKIDSDYNEALASGDTTLVKEVAEVAMNRFPDSALGKRLLDEKFGLTGTIAKNPLPQKDWKPSAREQAIKDRNLELVQQIIAMRAEMGGDKIALEGANVERAQRRLSEAVAFAESRDNDYLVDKLSTARVLPSGSFVNKETGKRVNVDSIIKDYVAEKTIESGREKIQGRIQSLIDAGVIAEGKYTHRDDTGTYTLSVSKGFDEDAFNKLPESTRKAISSPKESISVDLLAEKYPERMDEFVSRSQVMEFSIGKMPDVGQQYFQPNLAFTGTTSEEAAENGLKSLSDFTKRTNEQFGSKKERTERKAENAEIVKSAVANIDGNVFAPARAYANGLILSTRRNVSRTKLIAAFTPEQVKEVSVINEAPDVEKARKVLSPEVFAAIFEKPKAALRITPKR